MKQPQLFSLTLVAIFSLISINIAPAAPILHVYLAEKFMHKHKPHYKADEVQDFILGTLYPDIDLGTVVPTRGGSHECGVTILSIKECEDPFLAGKKLHCFIDEFRQECVKESNIDNEIKNFSKEFTSTLLKLVEDELVYNQIDLAAVKHFLNSINKIEISNSISRSEVQSWHDKLTKYFNSSPQTMLTNLSTQNKGYLKVPANTIFEWNKCFAQIVKNKKITQYLDRLIKKFTEL